MSVKINYDLCKPHCYQCQNICPNNVFWPREVISGKEANKPEVRYPADCHECMMLWACEQVCPSKAIEIIPIYAFKDWFPM